MARNASKAGHWEGNKFIPPAKKPWEKYGATKEEDIPKWVPKSKQQEMKDLLKEGAITTGALATGGATVIGAKAAFQKLREPYIQKKAITGELQGMQKKLGIEGTEAVYIPKKIGELQRATKQKYSDIELGYKNRAVSAVNTLKQNLNTLDNKVLTTKADDLAMTIKSGFPGFARSASQGYKAGMDAIEGFLADKGITISPIKFGTDVIDKTIESAREAGYPEENIQQLLRVKEAITPKINEQGMLEPEVSFSFGKAKGLISNITKNEPYSGQSSMLRENWGDFLEKNLPSEASAELKLLNESYKPFAEARNAIIKLSNPKTGEFDTKGLTNYFLNYAKKNIDNGAKNLMELIGEGSNLVTPIGGVKEKFEELGQLKIQRVGIKEAIPKIQANTQVKLQEISARAEKELNNFTVWKSKAEELISKLKVQEGRIENRNVIARAFKTITGLGKIAPFLSISTQIFDAINYAQDPEGYLYQMETGQQMPPEGEQREKWKRQQLQI